MSKKITLKRNVIRAIEFLSYDCDMSHEEILAIHKDTFHGDGHEWEGKAKELNGLPLDTLRKALKFGFVVDTSLDGIDSNLKNETINKAQELYNSIKALEAELDYELLSLHEAIKNNDVKSIERIKKRLAEIHQELGLGLKNDRWNAR